MVKLRPMYACTWSHRQSTCRSIGPIFFLRSKQESSNCVKKMSVLHCRRIFRLPAPGSPSLTGAATLDTSRNLSWRNILLGTISVYLLCQGQMKWSWKYFSEENYSKYSSFLYNMDHIIGFSQKIGKNRRKIVIRTLTSAIFSNHNECFTFQNISI
jgi:hypothetical protein